MTPEEATEQLSRCFTNSSCVYMILVSTSRTGRKRSYRLFIISAWILWDITGMICKATYVTWNTSAGTYDAMHAYKHEDATALESDLRNVLKNDSIQVISI